MTQSPTRSDPTESEHRGLPMVVPEPGELQEGWLARVMRILFGWKAAATRADLELVLTAEQPRIRLLARRSRDAQEYPRACANAGSSASWCRAPTSSRCSRTSRSANWSRCSPAPGIRGSSSITTRSTIRPAWSTSAIWSRSWRRARQTDPADAAGSRRNRRPPISISPRSICRMPLSAAKIVREILYAPPSMPALDLLAKMQATRIHLALVIDEYGGTRRARLDRRPGRADRRRYRRRTRRGRDAGGDATERRLVPAPSAAPASTTCAP